MWTFNHLTFLLTSKVLFEVISYGSVELYILAMQNIVLSSTILSIWRIVVLTDVKIYFQ